MAVALLLSALLFMILPLMPHLSLSVIAEFFFLGVFGYSLYYSFSYVRRRVPMKSVEQQWNDEYVIDCICAFAAAYDRAHRSWLMAVACITDGFLRHESMVS